MRSPVLVSRTLERARLRGALEALGEGRGGLWVLRGDPGIGKSRLATAVAAEAADRGLEVLSGRAVPSGTPTPLRPLSEALLGWLRTHEVPDDRLLAPYLPTLARLAPQLGPVAPDGVSSVMLLGEGLLRLARTVAAPGMVLVIEDLHWADPETLALVEYLGDNTGEVPLLVLATSRLHESPVANELVSALERRRSAETVDLLPMADDDIAAMARACLDAEPSGEVVAWLQKYSAGYPLFVEEMLADLSDAGLLEGPLPVLVPRPFARSVEGRLAEVGPAAREVATAAAMLGPEFDWRLVAEALGLSDTDVAGALRELRDQRLVVAVPPDRFVFRHALTREAVPAGLLAPERARLAGVLAAALAGRSTDSADDHHQLAELFEAAGDDARAVELWLATARDAIDRGALVSAREAIGRALERCTPGSELESRAREAEVEVHALAGDVPRALEAGERLTEELADDPGRLAAVRLRLARALLAGGRWDEAEAMLDAAAGHDPVQAHVLAARLALGREDDLAAAERASAALAAVGEDRPEIACEAWEVLGRATRARDHVAGEEAFEAGYRLAEAEDLPLWRCRLLAALGGLDLAARRPTEDRLMAARRVALDVGAIAVAARIEIDLNLVRIRYLDLDDAMAAVDNAITMMDRLRLPELPTAYLLRAATHGLAGRTDAMEADVATAGTMPMDEALRLVGIPGHIRSFVALGHGRYDEARAQLATAMEYHRRTPSMPFSLRGFWALLETAVGDDGGAAAREEVRTGPQANSPHNAFALRYADAIALGRAGASAEAERVFADAEWGLPGREPWPELHARLLVATAAARDGWGTPEPWFRHCLDGLVGYGLTEAASGCRVAMREAGFAVPRKAAGAQRVPTHLQRLGVTAREHDVLGLVAEGLQNKQIADRLYLSVRTVETHVARLLQRTGCADRSELAAHLEAPTA
ncbi:AAA family ATPase [Nocardioides sp. QY071]|uniref:ATP-binding protein n=1 Tax=Nocardioides sp. QY071 TaxID=3044187 RepID=UPI00249B0DC7|nr:LuxR family transcriptional regulator [Nocardioides sp. QY071]WGY03586.1 AAA family ATPase [Nocardioides sp. QY071]